MGIPLNTGGSQWPPGVKFRAPGQYVDLAIIDVRRAPYTDFATGQVKRTDDGKEREQEVVIGVCLRATGFITDGDLEVVVPVGKTVTLWCAGSRRWDFIQAQKKLDGPPMVGDVMRATFTGEEPGKGASPKKVWEFQFRHPRPEEAEQTAMCERLHREGSGTPLSPAGSARDEEPF
jgi:hypothetical protein